MNIKFFFCVFQSSSKMKKKKYIYIYIYIYIYVCVCVCFWVIFQQLKKKKFCSKRGAETVGLLPNCVTIQWDIVL